MIGSKRNIDETALDETDVLSLLEEFDMKDEVDPFEHGTENIMKEVLLDEHDIV